MIDFPEFGAFELIAPTYAGGNLHLYKSALFPRIYNVGLIKDGRKKGDILPARILAVVLADRKTRRHGNDDVGRPMVEGNERAFSLFLSLTERKISTRYTALYAVCCTGFAISARIRSLALWRTFPNLRERIVYHSITTRSASIPFGGVTAARINGGILSGNFKHLETISIYVNRKEGENARCSEI